MSIFKKVQDEARRNNIKPRTKESATWFRKQIQALGTPNRNKLLKDSDLTKKSRLASGQMGMFFYDPKHRDSLPFYDAFPLIIVVGPAPKGFYGLNLHYLPPYLRAKLLDALMDTTTNKKFNENTRMKVTYQMLSSISKFKEFAPCFKRYLYSHVQSSYAMVDAEDWELAIYLKTEQFRKANARKVWADSRSRI